MPSPGLRTSHPTQTRSAGTRPDPGFEQVELEPGLAGTGKPGRIQDRKTGARPGQEAAPTTLVRSGPEQASHVQGPARSGPGPGVVKQACPGRPSLSKPRPTNPIMDQPASSWNSQSAWIRQGQPESARVWSLARARDQPLQCHC